MKKFKNSLKKIFGIALMSVFLLTGSVSFVHAEGYGLGETAQAFGFDNYVFKLGVQSDQKVLAAGYFTSYNGTSVNNFVRLNSVNSLDTDYFIGMNGGVGREILDLKVLNDDTTLLFGSAGIIRFDSDGNLFDFATSTNFNDFVKKGAIGSDGKIYAVGRFSQFNDDLRGSIARLNTDGSLDRTYATGTGFKRSGDTFADMYALALDEDDNAYVGGDFNSYNGVTISTGIVKLDSEGEIDPSFDPGTGFDAPPDYITIDPNGKLIVTGSFITS